MVLRAFSVWILALAAAVIWPHRAYALEDADLAVAAAQYRQLVQDRRPVAGQTPQALGRKAAEQAARKDWAAAIASQESTLAAGGGLRAWLELSQLWQQHAEAAKNDSETRARAWQRARQAAWNAHQLASTDSKRARTLVRLGELYDQAGEFKQALAAFRDGLALEDSPRFAKRYQELVKAHAFRITGVETESNSATPKVCLQFSDKLSQAPHLHYADYVDIDPAIQAVVTAQEQQLCVEGVQHGHSYTITARAGIPAANGEQTDAAQEFTAQVEDRQPALGFRGTAYVLPRHSGQQLPLVSVNTDTARLRVLRINDRNLLNQVMERRPANPLDGQDLQRIAQTSGELLWEGTLTLASGTRNQEVTTAIPVQELVRDLKPGIYIVAAEPLKAERDSYENRATQWLVVSDIGLFTLRGHDGLHVFTRSLATAQPLAGLDLRLYARNNSELNQLKTDGQGYARLDPGLLRGTGGREAALLMAYGNNDYNFLDLSKPAFDLSDRGVEGRAAPGPIDGFLYTERGVYRPGETVELMALVRDSRGYALPNAPLMLKLFRPDGVEAGQPAPGPTTLGAYHVQIPLALNARTGAWTVKAYSDPKGEPVGQVSFQVEDFMPQQLKLDLSTAATVLKPDEPAQVTVVSQFLYGAPAANLKAEAEVVLAEDPNPYPAFPGYRFGLAQESWTAQRFPVALVGTDAEGKAQAQLTLTEQPDTSRPLQARLRVSVFEPGGRPVNRSLNLPYRPQPFAIGLKPRFSDDGVPLGQEAGFDIIALDPRGQPLTKAGLQARIVREDRDYYWYYGDNRWDYKLVVRDGATVSIQTLNLTADHATAFNQRMTDWGDYRLEVLDPATGVASSVRFTAGWFSSPSEQAETPDQMKVTLDQPRYQAGQTAQVFIRAPFAGEVLVNVTGDRLWLSKTVTLPQEGTTVALPIPADWGPGVYIAATAFRAAEKTHERGPGRAIGVAWLGLDPAPRTLNVALTVPTEWQPRQTVHVPVTITGLEAGHAAYVTLAAVDEGILQLTDFKSPDPAAYFLGKRRLGMELRDLYGKLIESGGRPGALKVGGDASTRQLDASGVRTVQTVALFSGPVAIDGSQSVHIPLVLPDFNGQLRLMAVAWSHDRLGRSEATPWVRDPLIARMNLPRFLAPDDTSQISVTAQNLSAPPGNYVFQLRTSGAVSLEGPSDFSFTVTDSTTPNTATQAFSLRGGAAGVGQIQMQITGPNKFQLTRTADIAVRPAQTLTTNRQEQRLNPGQTLTLGTDRLQDYVSGTATLRLSVSRRPNLNVPALLAELDRYPYGCLEQTTSRALPLLYFNQVAQNWLGQNATEASLRNRVQNAVARIFNMQGTDGGFGLWNSDSPTETWLSAFALDFLTRAREENYLVPETAYQRGLSYLQAQVNQDSFDEANLGWRAYALYVLARVQKAAIGELRYLHDTHLAKLPSALAQAQLGAALARYGELARAQEAFTAALARTERVDTRDYGTPLRDRAALLALLAESGQLPERIAPLAGQVAADFNQRHYSSTQEQAWLLLAARGLLTDQPAPLQLAVNGQTVSTEPFYLNPTAAQLAQGLHVVNQSDQPAWAVLNVSGAPATPQPPAQEGFSISRRYYTRTGQTMDPSQIHQNDLLVVVITGQADGSEAQQALVVDLLPAGLEIENARLAHNSSTADMAWLPKLTETLHTEIRDDRFVAALDLAEGGSRAFTLAYLARAVTPGVYQQPAVFVEEMYKPWRFGRGAMGVVHVH